MLHKQKPPIRQIRLLERHVLVEAVGDGDIFNNVDRVQDVASSRRDCHPDPLAPAILHLHGLRRSQLHLGAQPADLIYLDLQQNMTIYIHNITKKNRHSYKFIKEEGLFMYYVKKYVKWDYGAWLSFSLSCELVTHG